MAYVAITPISKSLAIALGVAQSLVFPFLNAAGAALDAHAYHEVFLNIKTNLNGEPYNLISTELIAGSTPSFTTPNTSFLMTAAEIASALGSLPSGQYQYTVTGVPVSADDPELMASGSLSVSAGA